MRARSDVILVIVCVHIGGEQAAMQQIPHSGTEIDLTRLRSGDKAAFAQVVEQYADPLYNLALQLLGNPQEAEDALQETFLNAYQAIESFEGRSSLNTWLYRIAYNTSLMQRRKKRAGTVSIDEPLALDDGQVVPRQFFDWCCLPERDLLSGEALEKMDEAIQQLPDSLRSVFVLRDIEGLSTSETGEVLDLSESAVKSRLHRARLFLREELSAYFAGRQPTNGGDTDHDD
jgi:RNA polymerase sigma-70 factor (ECF subfamily)